MYFGGASREFLSGLTHGEGKSFKFLSGAICAWKMADFGAAELEISLTCRGVAEEVSRVGDAEEIGGHEVHARGLKHLKHIDGGIILS